MESATTERAFYNFLDWLGRLPLRIGRALLICWRLFAASGFRRWAKRMLFPIHAERQRILTHVSRVVADQLFIVQDDWVEHLLDHRQAPEFVEARNRAKVRVINAILSQLRREFPEFNIDEGRDALDMQDAVHGLLEGAPKVRPIAAQKGA